MKCRYLRCPVCGKLSQVANFQIHNIGGRHRFPDIMIQEISSTGRGKIQNEWHSEKLDFETKQGLNKFFSTILSQVLDDIEEIIEVEVEAEDEDIQVEIEKDAEKGKKKKKPKDEEIFEVKDEVEGILKESDDEIVAIDDDEVFQGGDDEFLDMEEEEAFRVF